MRGLGIGITVTALILTAVNFGNKKGGMTDAEVKKRAAELGMVEANSYSLIDATSGSDKTGRVVETVEDTGNEAESGNAETSESTENTGDEAESGNAEVAENAENIGDEAESEKPETTETAEIVDNAGNGDGNEKPETAETTENIGDGAESGNAETAETTENTGNSEESEKPETAENTDKTGDGESTEPSGEAGNAGGNTKPGDGTIATITISSGFASETAASVLEKAGVINDAEDFNLYMIRNGYDRRIHPGTYNIEVGASYETICQAIAG